ncbi:MAG TPA: metallophosphoesterase [Blastocatellia bacterium]|nr:metallophosphoesterase [Blastocatellia bacterium]
MPWGLRMLLMFALAGGLFQLYVARKTITALSTVTGWPRRRVRLTAIAVAVWIVLYPLLMVGGYYFGFEQVPQAFQRADLIRDALFTYPFWIGVIFAIQVSLLFLIMDVVRLLLFPLYKKHKVQWLKVQSLIVIALAVVGVVYVAARIYSDTFTLRTRETELRVRNLPAELDGFRIVQIADVQADGRTNGSKLQRYVDLVNRLEADIVLFGGDLVTGGTDYIEIGAQAMSKMEAKYGVYACLGDHDFFSNSEKVSRSLKENGITLLDNAVNLVPVGSTHIALTGITNTYRTRLTTSTLDAVERERPQGPVNILLTHQPSEWLVDYAAAHHYDLFVAGHTHGGQIVFPLPGFLLTGSSFETRYVTGFYKAGDMLVSINNGLGLTLAPIRYQAPAEVTVITLRPAQ